MDQSVIVWALITWVVFIPVAFLNGTLRQLWYGPKVGERAANQISTLTGSLAFIVLAYFMMRNRLAGLSVLQLLAIGAGWVVLTFLFECGIGLVTKKSWEQIFADYNLAQGRLWPLLLLVVFLTPLIISYIN